MQLQNAKGCENRRKWIFVDAEYYLEGKATSNNHRDKPEPIVLVDLNALFLKGLSSEI
jgi:hypothetical protein